jgi:hypothetical protein
MLSRITEIIKHESIADRNDHFTSQHRWAAAQLIWEEIDEGNSRRGLAQEIGKSHTHVRYMYNCWDIVGRKLELDGEVVHSKLPNFNDVYHSVEVRGDPESSAEGDGGSRKLREAPDHTAHGHVMAAASAIDALLRNPAYWPLLTDDDWVIIRELPAVIDGLLTDSGHLCAKRLRGGLVPNRLSCL